MSGQSSEYKSSGRLITIDAMRGYAVLGVVLIHCHHNQAYVERGYVVNLEDHGIIFNALVLLFSYAFTCLLLFFIISGFCIHLRWAKATAQGKPYRIDFAPFWKRRIRRLYPAYIVAIAITVAVLAARGWIGFTRFAIYDVFMHLTMLHNFDPRTVFSLNPVFWSLAVEEQLYLVYFATLFLRKRLGWLVTLAICLVCRPGWYLFCYLIGKAFHVELSYGLGALTYWYVWALGAIAVEAAFGLVKLPRWCRSLKLGLVTCLIAAALTYADRIVATSSPFEFGILTWPSSVT